MRRHWLATVPERPPQYAGIVLPSMALTDGRGGAGSFPDQPFNGGSFQSSSICFFNAITLFCWVYGSCTFISVLERIAGCGSGPSMNLAYGPCQTPPFLRPSPYHLPSFSPYAGRHLESILAAGGALRLDTHHFFSPKGPDRDEGRLPAPEGSAVPFSAPIKAAQDKPRGVRGSMDARRCSCAASASVLHCTRLKGCCLTAAACQYVMSLV